MSDRTVEERLEDFERKMDGVTASNNLALAALGVRYKSIPPDDEDGEDVVLVMPREVWSELCDQADMFMAVMSYIKETEQGENRAEND